MTNRKVNLSFTELALEELDYVFIETTNRGPFVDDLFFEIVAGTKEWRIPSSQFPIKWLTHLPNVNHEVVIQAQLSVDNAYFLAWAREADLVISSERKTHLNQRAQALLLKLFVIQPVVAKTIADSLLAEYSVTSRHYHGLRHVAQCLKELDSIEDAALDKDSIELAIWYHDVIYKAGSTKNETLSAERLVKDVGRFESKVSIQKVEQMICATKQHSSAADYDTQTLLDIDLSILGKRHHDYESYRCGVRQEFSKYSGFKFNLGRRKFLKQLLVKPIFQTASMESKYEKAARENIGRELQSLNPLSGFKLSNIKCRLLVALRRAKMLGPLALTTSIYAALSYIGEYKFGAPYIFVATGIFLLGRGICMFYLRTTIKKDRDSQGRNSASQETFGNYSAVPIVFAVCIRIADYSLIYSALIMLGLSLSYYCFARAIIND